MNSAQAGSIVLSWDPTPNATGYHVYYGTSSGTYDSTPITTYGTSATIDGLQDCRTYFVAVKAFNSAGESPDFSNELSGWSRPTIASTTPSSIMQGDQVVMDIAGANFQSGARVEFGNPQIVLASVAVLGCNHIQLLATVEPTAKSVRPAPIGPVDVVVSNLNSIFGAKSQVFQVQINPARFDINQTDATTTNRIDGKDTVFLSRAFGINESDPNYNADDDFDGDGWVDGNDLSYIAANLGKCWSSTTKSWTVSACPSALQ